MSKINETNYPRRPQSDYEDTDMLIIQEAGGNTYTTRIEDIREDCQEAIAPIVEAVNDALAPPENGSTASQSYAIGEHFMRNGEFCTAIAAITSGASFTLNTNYVVGTIAEALESLNSQLTNHNNTISATTYTSNVDVSVNKIFRSNDRVHLSFVVMTSGTFPTGTDLFTIPEAYRPSADKSVPALLHHTSDVWYATFVNIISSTGKIRQTWSSSVNGVWIDTEYLL